MEEKCTNLFEVSEGKLISESIYSTTNFDYLFREDLCFIHNLKLNELVNEDATYNLVNRKVYFFYT